MNILTAEFLSNDLAGTHRFYTGIMGMPVVDRSREAAAFRAGQSTLRFRHSELSRPIYHFAFNIPENTFEEALRYYQSRQDLIPFQGNVVIDFKAWNAHSFYFHDNNGNVLEVIARHDLHNAREEAFNPGRHLLSVSEVAVVTPKVPAFCEDFHKETGITHYDKQPPHDNFAALGDANGLLIVSAAKRHWFPTEIEAKAFPLRLQLEALGVKRNFEF